MNASETLKFTGKDSSIVGSGKTQLLKAFLEKFKIQEEFNKTSKQDYSGKIPGIFVGSFGYPNISAGVLSSQNYKNNDNPLLWSKEGSDKFSLFDIIKLRSNLVNSRFTVDAVNFTQKMKDGFKEASISKLPLDAEIYLEKKPFFKISLERDLLPVGPSVALKKITPTQNAKVPRFVEKLESDIDLKASSAISLLYKKKFDEHYVTRIFSGGNIGIGKNRKLVPTKWAITAVDDTIGKNLLLNEIMDYKEHDESIFFGGYMGNYYLAIVFPGHFSFELYETYVGSGLENPLNYEFATDYEDVFGRKSYVHETAGGYYASRLAVLEYFKQVKRKGKVLLLRFITDKYWAPLGVWVVREAARNAFRQKSLKFESRYIQLKYARELILNKYGLDIDKIYKSSKLLYLDNHQKTLNNF